DHAGTEDEAALGGPRAAAETLALGLADRGVRASVIRLAPSVHSYLDLAGFVPALIGFARKAGFAAYVGDGDARWPGVHTLDAAVLYRLALEQGEAGSRFHGTGEEGVPFREIAETIAEGTGLPAKSVAPDEAGQYLSFLAGFSQLDNPMSSALTQQRLGWQPTGPLLLDDIEANYFTEARLAG
ncbi:MAG: 3-beta hydroxysteroid dehydrogenase, partial [Solirubrobacteraceae bacterium]|nr:3-beta hydroxysteroid dehydrogenase [Solirubrobacteraceae bacterium]